MVEALETGSFSMSSLEDKNQGHGSLIALEGNRDAIATQMRLLPPSQKILVLPCLNDELLPEPDQQPFNARAFVREIHDAHTKRIQTARSFIRSSTQEHPRLVFLNGGSVSARTACITRICENLTNGDVSEAESIFNQIVQDGLEGLMRPGDNGEVLAEYSEASDPASGLRYTLSSSNAKTAIEHHNTESQMEDAGRERGLDPGADQQPTTIDAPSISKSPDHGRGSACPTISSRKDLYASPTGDDIITTVLTVPNRITLLQKRGTFGPDHPGSVPLVVAPQYTPALSNQPEDVDINEDDFVLTSPEEPFLSIPASSVRGSVVIGEACLVDVQSGSPTRLPRRANSVDRFYPSNSRFHDTDPSPVGLRSTRSSYNLSKRNRLAKYTRGQSFDSYSSLPRTVFVRASETTIRKSSKSSKSSGSQRSSTSQCDIQRRTFIDRGTNVPDPSPQAQTSTGGHFRTYTPVFPIEEDLVIRFADGELHKIFDSVLLSYENGTYPIPPNARELESPSLSETASSGPSLKNTTSRQSDPYTLQPKTCIAIQMEESGFDTQQEFDPYSPSCYNTYLTRTWKDGEDLNQPDSGIAMLEPPTPAATPPLPSGKTEKKFVELNANIFSNAINVQNNLRQLLSTHFPAGPNGFSQNYYSTTAEADRMWKSVFRGFGVSNMGNEGRTIDQILALGCEVGVKHEFFYQMSGQIERLGTKRDGANRSGKLDIRYLMANAMQTYYSGPGPTDKVLDPLVDTNIIAALLIPQIEAYLACNASTRLLVLQYPAEYLPIVLALRTLIGPDLLKVAAILDSLASDPPPMGRPRGGPTNNSLSNQAIASRNIIRLNSLSSPPTDPKTQPNSKPNKPSFSKADYLLPSTATDAEITTFLSGIWKILMDKSAFYIPEPEPRPIIIERPPMPPSPSVRSLREREREREQRDIQRDSSSYQASNYRGAQSKISKLTGTSSSSRAPSSAPSNSYSSFSRSPTSPSIAPSEVYSSYSQYQNGGSYSTSKAPSLAPSQSYTYHSRHTNAPSITSVATTKRTHNPSISSYKTSRTERAERRVIIEQDSEQDQEQDGVEVEIGIGRAGERNMEMEKEGWENFYIGDEDSEDDEFDKMILGRGLAKIVPEVRREVGGGKEMQNRDKRKALKWLGLA